MAERIPIAFLAGLLSVLTPCVLPLVPGYLAAVSAVEPSRLAQRGMARRVVVASLPFVLGFTAVFALSGIYHAAINVSGQNIVLELSPTPEERPTYVGLANTSSSPIAFAAPLGAGIVVDRLGFPAVFAIAAGFSLLALGLLVLRVREPRLGMSPALPDHGRAGSISSALHRVVREDEAGDAVP